MKEYKNIWSEKGEETINNGKRNATGNTLRKEGEIIHRWQEYFEKLTHTTQREVEDDVNDWQQMESISDENIKD